MAVTIDTTYARAYEENMIMLAQQTMSRLEAAIRVKRGVKGESSSFDRIGARSDPDQVTSRFGDSPHNDSAYSRRVVFPEMYRDGELIDRWDTLQMLGDPSSDVSRSIRAAFERWKDSIIVDAALGTAFTGKNGTVSESFPAGQIVAVDAHGADHDTGSIFTSGDAPLTPGKINAAIGLLGANEADMVDEGGRPTVSLYCSSIQLTQMRRFVAYTSSDYARSLLASLDEVIGAKTNMFMGVNIIRGERFNLTGSNEQVICFHRDGLGLSYWEDIQARMTERADKSYMPYWFFEMQLGAVRIESERVVQILCTRPSLLT